MTARELIVVLVLLLGPQLDGPPPAGDGSGWKQSCYDDSAWVSLRHRPKSCRQHRRPWRGRHDVDKTKVTSPLLLLLLLLPLSHPAIERASWHLLELGVEPSAERHPEVRSVEGLSALEVEAKGCLLLVSLIHEDGLHAGGRSAPRGNQARPPNSGSDPTDNSTSKRDVHILAREEPESDMCSNARRRKSGESDKAERGGRQRTRRLSFSLPGQTRNAILDFNTRLYSC